MRRRDGWLMASKAPKGGWMGGHHMERKRKKNGERKGGTDGSLAVSSGSVTLLPLFSRIQMRTDGCPT